MRRPPVVVVRPPVRVRDRLLSSWCPVPVSARAAWSGMPDAAVTEVTSRITAKAPLARGFLFAELPASQHGNGRTRSRPPESDQSRSPVTAAPVATAAAPVAATPAPMTTAPTPAAATPAPAAPAPSPVATAAPAHLFGRETIHLVAGRDRRARLGVSRRQPSFGERLRRRAARPRALAASAAAPAANPKASFRKWRRSMTSPWSRQCGVMRGDFDRGEMNAR